jgi:surfactin synthase thioesterase subunit
LPPELTQWPALRDTALDAARVDLRLCMTDDDVGDVALPCPIHVFGGRDDPLVSESDLSEWRSRTSGHFAEHVLDGDHFYLTHEPKLFATLRPVLAALMVR